MQKPRIIDTNEPWFTHILEGRKPVEGRKGSPTWCSVKAGDVLRFRDPADHSRTFLAEVTGVTRYDGLRAYLVGETLARALPGVKTLEEGEAIYLKWSTADEIAKYGMLGIQVRVVSPC